MNHHVCTNSVSRQHTGQKKLSKFSINYQNLPPGVHSENKLSCLISANDYYTLTETSIACQPIT